MNWKLSSFSWFTTSCSKSSPYFLSFFLSFIFPCLLSFLPFFYSIISYLQNCNRFLLFPETFFLFQSEGNKDWKRKKVKEMKDWMKENNWTRKRDRKRRKVNGKEKDGKHVALLQIVFYSNFIVWEWKAHQLFLVSIQSHSMCVWIHFSEKFSHFELAFLFFKVIENSEQYWKVMNWIWKLWTGFESHELDLKVVWPLSLSVMVILCPHSCYYFAAAFAPFQWCFLWCDFLW